MMSFDLLRNWVRGTDGGRENIVPGEFYGGVGVFSFQGVRQGNFAKAIIEVFLVNAPDPLQVFLEKGYEGMVVRSFSPFPSRTINW
jgi:hypothetical protein